MLRDSTAQGTSSSSGAAQQQQQQQQLAGSCGTLQQHSLGTDEEVCACGGVHSACSRCSSSAAVVCSSREGMSSSLAHPPSSSLRWRWWRRNSDGGLGGHGSCRAELVQGALEGSVGLGCLRVQGLQDGSVTMANGAQVGSQGMDGPGCGEGSSEKGRREEWATPLLLMPVEAVGQKPVQPPSDEYSEPSSEDYNSSDEDREVASRRSCA